MPWVNNEPIAAARESDPLSYLRNCDPGELAETRSPGESRTVSHGSLVISNGKWIWNRGKIGGRSALDYLTKICGMRFNNAVEAVLGSRAAPVLSSSLPGKSFAPPPPKKWTFYPPKRDSLSAGGVQERNFIPEGDLYRLIARSELPAAERFERWIFDEVLPIIRKRQKESTYLIRWPMR